MRALLPAGTSLQTAASGFDSLRQILLAVNLALDLNISFNQLQAYVTGSSAMSFDQALSALLPNLSQASIKSDIETARQQTSSDLQTALGTSADEKVSEALGH